MLEMDCIHHGAPWCPAAAAQAGEVASTTLISRAAATATSAAAILRRFDAALVLGAVCKEGGCTVGFKVCVMVSGNGADKGKAISLHNSWPIDLSVAHLQESCSPSQESEPACHKLCFLASTSYVIPGTSCRKQGTPSMPLPMWAAATAQQHRAGI
jgi:hypothetical protein